MSLTPEETHLLREAIYVASQGANPTLATALVQLNEMVLDGTYPSWTNKAVIDSAIGRSPGYQAAWDSLLRELKDAPPIGVPNPTPEPIPPVDAYPHPVPEPQDSDGQLRLGQPDFLNTIPDPMHTQEVVVAPNVNRISISNTNGASDQWRAGVRSNMVSEANGDGGIRWWMNFHQTSTSFGAFEKYRPTATWALDSAGMPSYSYRQPEEMGRSPFSKVGSQTFVINGAGADSPNYSETEDVSLMTMQGGRYMDFRTCATTNAPRTAMKLAPDGEDRVIVFVGGKLRRLTIDAEGRPAFEDA